MKNVSLTKEKGKIAMESLGGEAFICYRLLKGESAASIARSLGYSSGYGSEVVMRAARKFSEKMATNHFSLDHLRASMRSALQSWATR